MSFPEYRQSSGRAGGAFGALLEPETALDRVWHPESLVHGQSGRLAQNRPFFEYGANIRYCLSYTPLLLSGISVISLPALWGISSVSAVRPLIRWPAVSTSKFSRSSFPPVSMAVELPMSFPE